MADKVGEEFDGIVSSVTNFGMFVELPNTIEGLVHVSNLTDDYYQFDDRQMMMIGERTKRQFRIGDEVKVRVIGVKPEESSIDFEIVGMAQNTRRSSRKETPKVIRSGRSGDKPRDGKKRGEGGADRKPKNKKKFYEKPAKQQGRNKKK